MRQMRQEDIAIVPSGPLSGLTSYFSRGTYSSFPKRQNVSYPHVERLPEPSLMFVYREMTLTIQKSNRKDNGSRLQ